MFNKFFKRSNSKGGASPLTPDVLNTISVFITVLSDFQSEVEGLYRENGDEKDVKRLENMAMAGKFDEKKLNEVCSPLSPHVLTAAFKRVLLAHQPLVPAELYDTVVSSQDLTGVLINIPEDQKEILQDFLRHISAISKSSRPQMDLSALAHELGSVVLRGPTDDGRTANQETKNAFKNLVTQKNRLFQAAASNQPTTSNPAMNTEQKVLPPIPAPSDPNDNVMNRSVKISLLKGHCAVSDEEVKEQLSVYGDVHQVNLAAIQMISHLPIMRFVVKGWQQVEIENCYVWSGGRGDSMYQKLG